MCESSGQLIAWLDRELPAKEADAVERHLGTCATCREEEAAYRRVGDDIAAYCDGEVQANAVPATSRRRLIASAAAVVAAVIVAAWYGVPRIGVEPSSGSTPRSFAPASIQTEQRASAEARGVQETRARGDLALREPLATTARVRSRQTVSSTHMAANRRHSELAIQITIPVDAMFPPGAVPAGVSLRADLTIAPDGSAQWLRVWP